jgi:hypothetical protein
MRLQNRLLLVATALTGLILVIMQPSYAGEPKQASEKPAKEAPEKPAKEKGDFQKGIEGIQRSGEKGTVNENVGNAIDKVDPSPTPKEK